MVLKAIIILIFSLTLNIVYPMPSTPKVVYLDYTNNPQNQSNIAALDNRIAISNSIAGFGYEVFYIQATAGSISNAISTHNPDIILFDSIFFNNSVAIETIVSQQDAADLGAWYFSENGRRFSLNSAFFHYNRKESSLVDDVDGTEIVDPFLTVLEEEIKQLTQEGKSIYFGFDHNTASQPMAGITNFLLENALGFNFTIGEGLIDLDINNPESRIDTSVLNVSSDIANRFIQNLNTLSSSDLNSFNQELINQGFSVSQGMFTSDIFSGEISPLQLLVDQSIPEPSSIIFLIISLLFLFSTRPAKFLHN